MRLSEFSERLALCPVIPAVREELFSAALSSPCGAVFLLDAGVLTVADRIRACHEKNKAVFVHMDLARGIGKDQFGVEFLARSGADGVISTRASLIKSARDAGMLSILRCFAVDTQSLSSARETIASAKPDCVEIMPGIINKVLSDFSHEHVLLIASGLIRTKSEILSSLGAGAEAVSTGSPELWSL